MSGLTKQQRVTAWRIVDEILGRPIPAVVLKHQAPEANDPDFREVVAQRAEHILRSLREDARDLWKEG